MLIRRHSNRNTTRPTRRVPFAILIATLAALLLAQPAVAATAFENREPGAVDPQNSARYQELAVEWWKWVFGTAQTPGGPFDAGPIHCAQGQRTPGVLFLAAPFNVSSPVTRICTDPVAPGTQIFFPVINTECSDQEPSPFFGATAADRLECVTNDRFNPSNLRARVDWTSFPVSESKYEIYSPDFAFTSVVDSPAGLGSVTGNSTTRGVWLLLKPLSKGLHRITFGGSYLDGPYGEFTIAATYYLYVR